MGGVSVGDPLVNGALPNPKAGGLALHWFPPAGPASHFTPGGLPASFQGIIWDNS
jgi:hypothetical protein